MAEVLSFAGTVIAHTLVVLAIAMVLGRVLRFVLVIMLHRQQRREQGMSKWDGKRWQPVAPEDRPGWSEWAWTKKE